MLFKGLFSAHITTSYGNKVTRLDFNPPEKKNIKQVKSNCISRLKII